MCIPYHIIVIPIPAEVSKNPTLSQSSDYMNFCLQVYNLCPKLRRFSVIPIHKNRTIRGCDECVVDLLKVMDYFLFILFYLQAVGTMEDQIHN